MTDETTTEDQNVDEAQNEQPKADEQEPQDTTEESTDGDEKGDEGKQELSHEDALKALEKTRKESAGYRSRLRDLEKRMEGLKSTDEVQSLLDEVKAENAKAERDLVAENVALKFNLPEKLAHRLSGETREEMEADAKELAEFFGLESRGNRGNPGGGLRPDSGADADFDPVKNRERFSRANRV